MNRLEARKPSFFAKEAFAGLWALAAGLTTAAATATGAAINHLTLEVGKRFEGVKFDAPISVTLDSGQSLQVTSQIEHSEASSSGWASLGDPTVTTVSHPDTGAGVVKTGVASVDRSLVGASKFVRVKLIRVGSVADTGSDIAASSIAANFYGANEEPV